MPNLIPVIGMEIHVELKTKSKMFCSCPNGYELPKQPNLNVCPVCLAHPGMLPVINRQAVEWTILTGLALNMKIAKESKFDRKNYFYPDLPKGYQISQYDKPLTYDGILNISGHDISITRIHLEEDTGMLNHTPEGSLVDLSRAGTPLMELVSGPEIKSAKEAKEFCQTYQQILRYLEVSDANMEKGQMRCEVNISMQETGRFVIEKGEVKPLLDYKLNPKVEIKNLNSFKVLEKATEYEIKRQTKAIEKDEKLRQETRGWDDAKQQTFIQRVKETAADYRYFPEPDLPPLLITDEWIQKLKASLPELPQAKIKRLVSEYQFKPEDAEILASDKKLASYAEQVYSELADWLSSLPEVEGTQEEILAREGKKMSKLIANWLINRLFKHLNEAKIDINQSKITPENFAEFIALIYQGKINNTIAQQILDEMFQNGGDPSNIIEEKSLGAVDNQDQIDDIIDKIVKDNPTAIKDYASGKENALKFLIGKAMAESKGKANVQKITELLKKKLKE